MLLISVYGLYRDIYQGLFICSYKISGDKVPRLYRDDIVSNFHKENNITPPREPNNIFPF